MKLLTMMTLSSVQQGSSCVSSCSAAIRLLLIFILLILEPSSCKAFSVHPTTTTTTTTTTQLAAYSDGERSRSRSASSNSNNNSYNDSSFRTKRQERVGHLVRTELSRILHRGTIKGYYAAESLDDELRQRISIVSADVSPDLRQARISVSIRAAVTPKKKKKTVADDDDVVVVLEQEDEDDDNSNSNSNSNDDSTTSTLTSFVSNNPAVDKRRAYSWLVRNNKALRHSLAQRMSHIKSCPQLSFVQIDVGAAVDVMQLIDQVTAGNKKRETIAVMEGDDDDNDDDEFAGDDWIDDDDDFF